MVEKGLVDGQNGQAFTDRVERLVGFGGIVFNLLSWTVFDEDLMLHCWVSLIVDYFLFFFFF